MKRLFGISLFALSCAIPTFAQQFVITTNSVPDGVVNQSYTAVIETANAAGNVTSCQLAVSPSNPGLFISPNGTSCVITGTPTQAGTYGLLVQARDSQNQFTPTRQYSMT